MEHTDIAPAERLGLIQRRVQERIGASRYRTWFGQSASFELCDDGVVVVVANAFVGKWIANNYMDDVTAAAREVCGEDASASVRLRESAACEPATDPGAAPPAPVRKRAAPETLVRGVLDSFVVGASNQLAFAAAKSLVSAPGSAFKLLVVHGGCGLGKTHLLQGICNGLRLRSPTIDWRYVSGEEFTNEFITAVKSGRVDGFRARFRRVDLLVVDDIHFLANKKATQEEFLHTYNAIDSLGKVVVLSSDRHPRSIATLSEPLINRLISGMVVSIDPPEYATRREILRRRAADLQHDLSDAVLDFVAERIQSNIRELEGALYKLVALSALSREPITLEMARRTLAEDFLADPRAVDPLRVQQFVCERMGVAPHLVGSKSRDRTVCLARALTMFLVRKHTTLSFPEIGRALGKKNHSTVLMAAQRIDRLVQSDAAVSWRGGGRQHRMLVRNLLEELEERLRPGT